MKTKIFSINAAVFMFSLLFTGLLYSQEYQCNSCAGSGIPDCIRCDGGIVHMPDGTTQTCNYCKGEGRVWHSCFNPLCNGGTVTCNFCGGQGQKICPSCNGTGKK